MAKKPGKLKNNILRRQLALPLFSLTRLLDGKSPFYFPRTSGKSISPLGKIACSDNQLKQIWLALRLQYFPANPELDDYEVRWSSRRQKRTLACCHLAKRKVRVARELKPAAYQCWLDPLLYHEMCHAYLGLSVEKRGHKRSWHGGVFKELERRHNKSVELTKWIKSGGWRKAVRSDRARTTFTNWRKARAEH